MSRFGEPKTSRPDFTLKLRASNPGHATVLAGCLSSLEHIYTDKIAVANFQHELIGQMDLK